MDKYVILPSSGDLNRGDQALVWETVSTAKKAGYLGQYYIMAGRNSSTQQSQSIGLGILEPILKHPSRKFSSKENNIYSKKLILQWGIVAILDLVFSLFMLMKLTRLLVMPLLPKKERMTIRTIKQCKACFVKGGGFIHSSGKITDPYTVYFQLFHILLAHSLGKPVYIMPNSFGPFSGFAVAWLVRTTLKKCKLVTVRESISKEMLEEIGVKSQLFPDLGFGLERRSDENAEVDDLRNHYPDRSLVAITARPYRFPRSPQPAKKYEQYIEGMVILSRWLYRNKYLPVFVEHTLSETTHENDGTAISEIISKLNKGEYSIISDKTYDCRDLKSLYREMDYVIGTRFHSVIFSLSEGTPSIAVTYGGNKGQGIMRDLGLSDYAIEISEFSAEKAANALSRLTENREDVCLQLEKNKLKINKELYRLVEELREERE